MPRPIDLIQSIVDGVVPQPPIGKLVGMRLTSVGEGCATFEIDVDGRHWNPMGTVHGGIFCDLADGALGMAFASTLGEGESFTTLELKVNFLKPFRKGKLRAEGKVKKRGKTIGLAECEVADEDGNLVAFATSTLMVLRGEQAKGR